MTNATITTAATTARVARLLDRGAPAVTHLGQFLSRYGLVVVLAWFGYGKYVKMDSRVLIEHSPLMSWIFDYLDATTVARGLGTLELVAAALVAVRPWWPRVCAAGSALTAMLFVGTLSFLFTTPGVVIGQRLGFLPVLSAQPGQFLLKDLVLIGVAIWSLGEALTADRIARTTLRAGAVPTRAVGETRGAGQ